MPEYRNLRWDCERELRNRGVLSGSVTPEKVRALYDFYNGVVAVKTVQ